MDRVLYKGILHWKDNIFLVLTLWAYSKILTEIKWSAKIEKQCQ